MITDALAFNRFSIISGGAVASGAVRTKVYNYERQLSWRSLLGVPFRKGLLLLRLGKTCTEEKRRLDDLSFQIHGFPSCAIKMIVPDDPRVGRVSELGEWTRTFVFAKGERNTCDMPCKFLLLTWFLTWFLGYLRLEPN